MFHNSICMASFEQKYEQTLNESKNQVNASATTIEETTSTNIRIVRLAKNFFAWFNGSITQLPKQLSHHQIVNENEKKDEEIFKISDGIANHIVQQQQQQQHHQQTWLSYDQTFISNKSSVYHE